MRRQPDAEQERPVPAAQGWGYALSPTGDGTAYKPTVKGRRAGRESEGSIVPLKPAKAGGSERIRRPPASGKGPCFGCVRVWR